MRPLLLVFEELHWIDSETQAFLDGFVDSLPRSRVLLAVNYRPEYRHGWGSKSFYRQLRIDPLSSKSAEGLLDALLGRDPSVEPIKTVLVARAEGRPLYIEESVRTLMETGALVGERGAYRLERAPDMAQIPATIQAIIAARIDRLEPDDKRLLQAAAVVGAQVPFALLRSVLDMDDDALKSTLARLQTADFMYEERLFPDLGYAFKHALTHEVAYGGLLKERRQALHARLVEAMEQLYADRLAEHVERLAHHAARGGPREKALHYLREAGSKALGRSANHEAIAYLEQALALVGEIPQSTETLNEELRVRLPLGQALIAVKGPQAQEVENLYLRALELVDLVGGSPSRFPVLWHLWYVVYNRAQHEAALKAAERLLEAARASNNSVELLEAHHAMWPTLGAMGRPIQALFHAQRGLALYDSQRHAAQRFVYGGHDPGACCRSYSAMNHWLAGWPDRALHDLQAAVRLAADLNHPRSTVSTSYFAAWVHHQRGELAPAMSLFEQAHTIATRHGFPRYKDHTEVVLRCAGGERLSLADMEGMRGLLLALRWPSWQKFFSICVLAQSYADSGYADRGQQMLRATVDECGETCLAAEVLRLEGELLARLDKPDPAAAAHRMREAIVVSCKQQSRSLQLRAVTSLARLLAREGRRDEARSALEGVYGSFSEGFDTADLRSAHELLDELRGTRPC